MPPRFDDARVDMSTFIAALPLFPLRTVLFPQGLLALKVFEARYLDLMSRCLRERSPFGVVCLREGSDVQQPGEVANVESVGTLARLESVDSDQPGILQVRCRGGERFRLESAPSRGDGGLWSADARLLEEEAPAAPATDDGGAVRALESAVAALAADDEAPLLAPLRFDDAGWVADRWCELLPIPLAARQKLLELADPSLRLQVIADFLRQKKVID